MKAILVIDVPMLDDGRHLCNECPIWNKEHYFCQYDFNMEAKGCPLKPMPQKKNTDFHPNIVYANGWNDCLEEISGENYVVQEEE